MTGAVRRGPAGRGAAQGPRPAGPPAAPAVVRRGAWGAARPDERGAGTVLTVSVVLVVCMATMLAAWVAGWVGSLHRGHQGADLAALAGAQAQVRGEDVCREAGLVATRNGTQMLGCSVEGDRRDFVVHVEVAVLLKPSWGGVDRRARCTATAGSLQRR